MCKKNFKSAVSFRLRVMRKTKVNNQVPKNWSITSICNLLWINSLIDVTSNRKTFYFQLLFECHQHVPILHLCSILLVILDSIVPAYSADWIGARIVLFPFCPRKNIQLSQRLVYGMRETLSFTLKDLLCCFHVTLTVLTSVLPSQLSYILWLTAVLHLWGRR